MNILSDDSVQAENNIHPHPRVGRPAEIQDTTFCPRAARCESCGRSGGLSVDTIQMPGGVSCVTLCTMCAPRAVFATDERISEHARHVEPPTRRVERGRAGGGGDR